MVEYIYIYIYVQYGKYIHKCGKRFCFPIVRISMSCDGYLFFLLEIT